MGKSLVVVHSTLGAGGGLACHALVGCRGGSCFFRSTQDEGVPFGSHAVMEGGVPVRSHAVLEEGVPKPLTMLSRDRCTGVEKTLFLVERVVSYAGLYQHVEGFYALKLGSH